MNFSTILENFNASLWGHHIIVPDDIVQEFLNAGTKRIVCTLNETHTFQCALMPKGDGQYFIMLNAEIRKKLRLHVGSKIKVTLKKDESKYGLPMPEEMEELLKIDDEANHYFHALTLGKQRSLLHIIGKPKKTDTRLHKAIVITEYLKATRGKLDFKELQEAFRNQR